MLSILGIGIAVYPFDTDGTTDPSYYAFPILADYSAILPFRLPSHVIHVPAGKHGRIVARGDKFYFEDGTSARFFGVGMTFSGGIDTQVPPDKASAAVIARKLVNYGINHVRFVGFDATAPEVYLTWKRTGSLACETMDRFDYFLAELRKVGIYYSLSLNNGSTLLLDHVKQVRPNKAAPAEYLRFKHVRLFDEAAIEELASWHRAFFSHINPYTGLSIASDPANVYVAAVNEDSIFIPYYQDYRHLDDEHRRTLNAQFSRFLQGRYGSTKELRSAWREKDRHGLDQSESVERQNVALPGYSDAFARKYSDRRLRDAMDFLVAIDTRFYQRILEGLQAAGYRGLFTGTNNWYGYGNFHANYVSGDYIETHGYFDHPKRVPRRLGQEAISNRSYLAGPPQRDSEYLLRKMFLSAASGKPLVVSEWNHSSWSDQAFEGPLLTVAYAAFQGYSALSAHTFFNHPNPDPRDRFGKSAFTVSTNPVLMALMPSLSLAFLRGDISEPPDAVLVPLPAPGDALLDLAATISPERDSGPSIAHTLGYETKVRYAFLSSANTTSPMQPKTDGRWTTSTGEIQWDYHGKNGTHLLVNTPRFKAAAGVFRSEGYIGEDFTLSLDDPGAVTIISLDDKPLIESRSILITAVSTFRNTSMGRTDLPRQRIIHETGGNPVLLKRVTGRLSFETKNPMPAEVKVIDSDGSEATAHDVARQPTAAGHRIGIRLDASSPWYWVRFPKAIER